MTAIRDDILGMVVEGATDRFFGRPLNMNPYSQANAGEAWRIWALAWEEADWCIDARGASETSRWLSGTPEHE